MTARPRLLECHCPHVQGIMHVIGFAERSWMGNTVGVPSTQAAPTCNHCDWAGQERSIEQKEKRGEDLFHTKLVGVKLVPRFDGALEIFAESPRMA